MISSALSMLETEEQRDILSEFYEENKNRFYGMASVYLPRTRFRKLSCVSCNIQTNSLR